MQAKTAHPLANKIPGHIIALFSDPVLQKGEDPAPYWKMISALIDEHSPSDVFAWTSIQDLATSLWEERFYRAASNAIIYGGRRLAVHQFFREINPGQYQTTEDKTDLPSYRADRYFSLNKQESGKVHSDLAKYGIGDAEILGRSIQNNIDAILKIESIVGSRKGRQRKLQKEMRRRGSSQQGKSGANADINLAGKKHQGSSQEVKAASNRPLERWESADLPVEAQSEVRQHGVSASGASQEMRTDTWKLAGDDNGISSSRSCQEEKSIQQHGH